MQGDQYRVDRLVLCTECFVKTCAPFYHHQQKQETEDWTWESRVKDPSPLYLMPMDFIPTLTSKTSADTILDEKQLGKSALDNTGCALKFSSKAKTHTLHRKRNIKASQCTLKGIVATGH